MIFNFSDLIDTAFDHVAGFESDGGIPEYSHTGRGSGGDDISGYQGDVPTDVLDQIGDVQRFPAGGASLAMRGSKSMNSIESARLVI